MTYLSVSIINGVIFVINLIILIKLIKFHALDSFINKARKNTTSALFRFVGIGLIAFSAHVWNWVKWPVILYYGVFGGISLIMLLIALIGTVIVQSRQYIIYPEKLVTASNIFDTVADFVIFIFALHVLF